MKNKTIKSTRVPVYRDSGFAMDNSDEMRNAFISETDHRREPDSYIYSRYRNPTVVAAEEEIMKVEGCEWALLTQSGMAAIDVAVSIFQKSTSSRPWLFFTEIYGGTISYLDSVLITRRGLRVERFAPINESYDLVDLESRLKELMPEFVYFETI
jgi:cystathionine beta-lyase/cystathionine gamma-synthase